MAPEVSVIIPSWNTEAFIQGAINSVLNQSMPDFEIIVVDNGSKDKSIFKIQEINDSRIRLIQLSDNKGASFARNLGLSHARGRFIQYLDSDDLISPQKLEKQIAAIKNRHNAIAFCDSCFFFDDENPWAKQSEPNHQFYFTTSDTLSFLLNLYGLNGRAGMIPIHAWLTPRSILEQIGTWNLNLTVDDDGEYFCRVMLAASEIQFVNNAPVYYRKHRQRQSLSREQTHNGNKSAYNANVLKLQHCLTKHPEDSRITRVFAKHFIELAYINWPEYPSLTKEALQKVRELGGTKHVPHIGNPLLDALKHIFGWKTMKWISLKKNSLFKAHDKQV
jgi:glycosyltransferase involved in cell wall biosynthesis